LIVIFKTNIANIMALSNETENAFEDVMEVESSDPFADLFPELSSEDQAFSAPSEEVPQEQQVAEPQISNEEQRVRDWQAKFDKLQSEFDSYKTQAEDVNKLWSYVQTDPRLAQEVFSTVERSLSGEGSSAEAAESNNEPQEPAKPEKPSDYSDHDAYMEPDSQSFKYRLAMEQYRSEYADYKMEKRMAEMQGLVAPIYQAFEQEKAQMQQQAQLRQIQTTFTESGLSDEEANVVTNWAAGYQVTPEDIVTLYKLKNGAVPQTPQAQTAAPDKLEQRNKALNFPVPSTTAGGQKEAPRTVETSMFDEILSFDRAANPFT
jgi:hypothetical protein